MKNTGKHSYTNVIPDTFSTGEWFDFDSKQKNRLLQSIKWLIEIELYTGYCLPCSTYENCGVDKQLPLLTRGWGSFNDFSSLLDVTFPI